MDKYTQFKVEGIDGGYPDEEQKPRAFRMIYDFNQIVEAETLTSYNLLQPLASPERMSAGQTRAMAFALLKTAHSAITLNEVGQLLSKDSKTVLDAIFATLEMLDGDDALFRSIEKLATERPIVLVGMLSRIKPGLLAEQPVTPEPANA